MAGVDIAKMQDFVVNKIYQNVSSNTTLIKYIRIYRLIQR